MVIQELQMKMPAIGYMYIIMIHMAICHIPFKLTLVGLLKLPVMLLQTTLLTEKVQTSSEIAAVEQVTEVVVRGSLVQVPQSDSVLY